MRYIMDDLPEPDDGEEGPEMDCEFYQELMMPSNMPARVWHEL